MKRFISILSVSALAATVAFAQGPGPGQGGPGQGGRQGQGRMGMGMQMGGGFRLILRPDVQKELNLTEAQKKTLQEKLPQMGGGRQGGGGNQGGGGGGRQGFDPQQMRQQAEQAEKTIKETLDANQYKRFKELQLQQQGANALMNPEVQNELGMTDAQKQKIQQIQQTAMDNMRDRMEDMRASGGGFDRETMQAEMQKMRQEIEKQMLAVLTPEQKTKFEAMKGKPFKFENTGRGGGGN